jgi:hypothetical protein
MKTGVRIPNACVFLHLMSKPGCSWEGRYVRAEHVLTRCLDHYTLCTNIPLQHTPGEATRVSAK